MRRWPVLLVALAGLTCIHRDAVIVVNSRPSGAAIWLDGDHTEFVTPHTFTGVYAGMHWLKVAFDDCYWEDTFTVSPKETRTFEPEIAQRIWIAENSLGITAPPAIAPDGTICVVTNNSELLGYDQSGNQRSNRPLPFSDASAVAIGEDGRVYVKYSSSLLALNPQGESLWSCPVAGGGGIALGRNGVVYSSGGAELDACDSQGVALWSCPLGSSWRISAPVVGTDGTVYVANSSGLHAVDSSGTNYWTAPLDYGGDDPLALGADGTIYVTGYSLSAFAPDGNMRWMFTSSGNHYITEGATVGPDGTIYACVGDTLFAVNPDGTRRRGSYLPGDGQIMPVISDDGRIYMACDNPMLAAFDADGKLLWRVSGSWVKSHPVLADSMLLVIDSHRMLAAYRVSGTGPAQGWPMFQHDARRSGRAQ